MNQKRLDAAMADCEARANFQIKGFRFHRNCGGKKGNRVIEAYGQGNYAVYAAY